MDGQITSSDTKEERIRKRSERVAAKSASKDAEKQTGRHHDGAKAELSRGKQQTADSLAQLDKKKALSIEMVTQIRVQGDDLENTRRIAEEDKRQARLQRLQEEAVQSGKQNAAVEMRWAELMEDNMPQELQREIESQKADCAHIISSKDKLIADFQEELKAKDEEYLKALKRQEDDVVMLIERMHDQFNDLQRAYATELENIEDSHVKQRQELLAANKTDIDTIFQKRQNMEMGFIDAKRMREEANQREMQKMRDKDADDLTTLRIKLGTDIQTLEQQLEEMRATYQLNSEKLDYNYRVLTERDMENTATLQQQRRRLMRLKDTLSNLMTKYKTNDSKFRQENVELTEEYRRITKQYKDLQNKFRHFEISDNKRFQEVWAMHEEDTSELVNTVLHADKVIHEQQLGWQWVAPHPELFARIGSNIGTSRGAARAANATNGPSALGTSTEGAGEGKGTEVAEGEEGSTADGIAIALRMSGLSTGEDPGVGEIGERRRTAMKLKVMLELLSSEASFLMDPKVRSQVEHLDKGTADVERAQSILKALNVSSESDIQRLLSYFFFDTAEADDEDEPVVEMTAAQLGLRVQTDEVVRVIKQYVEDVEQEKRDAGAAPAAAEEMSQAALVRERTRRDEKQFWKNMSRVVPERTFRVWAALEGGLVKYNKLLKERSGVIDEVSSLHRQNEELKLLLNQYLSAPVNDDMQIPPTQVIQVDAANTR